MEEKFLDILKNYYDMVPDRYDRYGRVLKFRHNGKTFALKKTNSSYEKLSLLSLILEKINSLNVLSFVKTKDNTSFAFDGNSCWTLTEWKNRVFKENKDESFFSSLAKALGKFHKASIEVVKNYPKLRLKFTEQKLDKLKEQKKNLSKVKDLINKRTFKSPFDKKVLQGEDLLNSSLEFAISGMEKYLEIEKGIAPRYVLCHNRLSSQHIVEDENNFYFINFDHAQVDTPAVDLAIFLKEFATNKEDAKSLLKDYESEFKLNTIEKKLVSLNLSMPKEALFLIKSYYTLKSKKEVSFLNKLERELFLLEDFQSLRNDLWETKTLVRSKVPVRKVKNKNKVSNKISKVKT